MPALRKTGVRLPFLPAPLQGDTNPLRQAVIIGALAPALLLGGNTQFVGRPLPAPERASRPAIVRTVAAPLPSAIAWIPRPFIDQSIPRSLLVHVPPVPFPGALVWAPVPAREPSADPRRPLIASVGHVPIPAAQAIPVGAVRGTPEERVIGWAAIGGGTQPPLASALILSRPPEATVAPFDQLAQTTVVGATQPVPSALALVLPALHSEEPSRPALIQVVVPAGVPFSGLALIIGRAADVPSLPIRARPLLTIGAASQPPGACALLLHAPPFGLTDGSVATVLARVRVATVPLRLRTAVMDERDRSEALTERLRDTRLAERLRDLDVPE